MQEEKELSSLCCYHFFWFVCSLCCCCNVNLFECSFCWLCLINALIVFFGLVEILRWGLLGFTCESNEKGKMLPYGFVDSEYGG